MINIASLSSFLAFQDVAAYCASKTALLSLTRSLACEWARDGISVNAIVPGVFPTEMNKALIMGTERGKELLMRTPMARFGNPEEVVGAAVLLASDGAAFHHGSVRLRWMEAILHRESTLRGRHSACGTDFSLCLRLLSLTILNLAVATGLVADNGRDAWLRYPAQEETLPGVVVALDNSEVTTSARAEVVRAFRDMTGKAPRIATAIPKANAIVLATFDKLPAAWGIKADLPADSYWLKTVEHGGLQLCGNRGAERSRRSLRHFRPAAANHVRRIHRRAER